jgi:hypothetical protein
MRLLSPDSVGAFWDELEKISASKLRAAVQIAEGASPHEKLFAHLGPRRFSISVGGKPAGYLDVVKDVDRGTGYRVAESKLNPEFRGMGLGRKLYGEVARRMPEQALASDPELVSASAERVWRSMARRPGRAQVTMPKGGLGDFEQAVVRLPRQSALPSSLSPQTVKISASTFKSKEDLKAWVGEYKPGTYGDNPVQRKLRRRMVKGIDQAHDAVMGKTSMSRKELQPGDIVLTSPGVASDEHNLGDRIGNFIFGKMSPYWQGTFTHSGIWDGEKMIEAYPDGIITRSFNKMTGGKSFMVLRPKVDDETKEKAILFAQKQVGKPYSKYDLALAGTKFILPPSMVRVTSKSKGISGKKNPKGYQCAGLVGASYVAAGAPLETFAPWQHTAPAELVTARNVDIVGKRISKKHTFTLPRGRIRKEYERAVGEFEERRKQISAQLRREKRAGKTKTAEETEAGRRRRRRRYATAGAGALVGLAGGLAVQRSLYPAILKLLNKQKPEHSPLSRAAFTGISGLTGAGLITLIGDYASVRPPRAGRELRSVGAVQPKDGELAERHEGHPAEVLQGSVLLPSPGARVLPLRARRRRDGRGEHGADHLRRGLSEYEFSGKSPRDYSFPRSLRVREREH